MVKAIAYANVKTDKVDARTLETCHECICYQTRESAAELGNDTVYPYIIDLSEYKTLITPEENSNYR